MTKRAIATVLAIACASTPITTPLSAQSSIPIKELTSHVMGRLGYAGLPIEVLGVNLAPPSSQFGLLANWASTQLFVTQPLPTDLTNAIASLAAGAEPSGSTAPTAHGWTVSELASKRILMAAFSPNQLRERMTNFWRTLFNTHFRIPDVYFTGVNGGNQTTGMKIATHAEWVQFEGFRANALGQFRDLLDVSIDSSAMRVYLNLNESTSTAAPNENYARELLELHTMGPANAQGVSNYTPADIFALARLLVGLGVSNGGLPTTAPHTATNPPVPTTLFASIPHVNTFTINATTNPALTNDPRANAAAFLDSLAAQPQCADYICRRIIRHFLADDLDYSVPAHANLLTACKGAWGTTGNITGVLATIITNPLFYNDATLMRNLVRTPFESEVAQIRRLHNVSTTLPTGASLLPSLILIQTRLGNMGQDLFQFPSPDGYPMAITAHTDTAKARIRFESALENFTGPFVPPPLGPYQFSGDPDHVLEFILGNNWDTSPSSPTQVTAEFLGFLFPGDVTPQDDNGGWYLLGQDPFTGVWASDWYSISAGDRLLRVKNLYAYACGLTQSIVR